ncbi:MAG: hypothetical protein IKC87_00435 [Clostridia bacterium]|nr:hypothetical protein [Clostridia bacterium]
MNFNEAKKKIDAALGTAEEKLAGLGITVTRELEVTENQISECESETLYIIGSLALTGEGLTEDDTYYLSIEARVDAGEVSEEALDEAIAKFDARALEAYERLSQAEDKLATLVLMGKEVDEELERVYAEEAAKNEKAIKKDLKLAIIGTVGIIVLLVLAVVLSKLL